MYSELITLPCERELAGGLVGLHGAHCSGSPSR
jgi:hypothetical protein